MGSRTRRWPSSTRLFARWKSNEQGNQSLASREAGGPTTHLRVVAERSADGIRGPAEGGANDEGGCERARPRVSRSEERRVGAGGSAPGATGARVRPSAGAH